MDHSMTIFSGQANYDPEALAALKSLDAFRENSQNQLLTQALKTEEAALQIGVNQSQLCVEFEALQKQLVVLKVQQEQLIQENNLQKQLVLAERTETAAWKTRAETAERLLAEKSEQFAVNEQKLRLQLEEAIKAKGEAVQLTSKIAEARLSTLKQQIQAIIDKGIYLRGHSFKNLYTFAGGDPKCSCHPDIKVQGMLWRQDDPNSFYKAFYKQCEYEYGPGDRGYFWKYSAEQIIRQSIGDEFYKTMEEIKKAIK